MPNAAVHKAVGAYALPGGEGVVGTGIQMDQIHHDIYRPKKI
jgi:hypothetical protein